MKTYHIYLKERCLFKNLDEDEFKVIWGRLYHSYWDDITYSEVNEKELEQYEEASF
tara:strand:+ start:773 stop:940 length:168 start_codon:yes stop_codon:yes gene_type:complete